MEWVLIIVTLTLGGGGISTVVVHEPNKEVCTRLASVVMKRRVVRDAFCIPGRAPGS